MSTLVNGMIVRCLSHEALLTLRDLGTPYLGNLRRKSVSEKKSQVPYWDTDEGETITVSNPQSEGDGGTDRFIVSSPII
jgi:hypothetical protein